jgi:hypothetical protein
MKENHKFKVSLGYKVRGYLKKIKIFCSEEDGWEDPRLG